jgi:hypothetical protein
MLHSSRQWLKFIIRLVFTVTAPQPVSCGERSAGACGLIFGYRHINSHLQGDGHNPHPVFCSGNPFRPGVHGAKQTAVNQSVSVTLLFQQLHGTHRGALKRGALLTFIGPSWPGHLTLKIKNAHTIVSAA